MTVQADSAKRQPAPGEGGEMLLVSFRLGDEEFGIQIVSVQEILRLPDITPIPRSPDFLTGITNIRGSILPVIDAKKRLKLPGRETSDLNRVLVVSHRGALTGMIVDEVNEVIRIDSRRIEAPPPVTRGIDRFYLSGIVKLDEGRLVMMLNLDEFLHLEMRRQEGQLTLAHETAVREAEAEHLRQEQLVSFFLGADEFAFDIVAVLEIIRAGEITAVPNVPEYVVGIRTLRNQILPVIDLRQIVHKPRLVDENLQRLQAMKQGHQVWIQALEESLRNGRPFTLATDPGKCPLGQLLADRRLSGAQFRALSKRIKGPHAAMHERAAQALSICKEDAGRAREFLETELRPHQAEVVRILDQAGEEVAGSLRREQKILILETRGMRFGLLVDRINEVLRIPASAIDSTPSLIASYGHELKGVAKLNDGARLIMIMEENSLISQKEAETLSQIGEGERPETQKTESSELSQHVVFSIFGEEFGIAIERVQEISKIVDITPVPQAPEFVAGLTNLRGTIIPIIDLRRRFGLTDTYSEFQSAVQEVARRFHGFHQALDQGLADGRLDELRQSVGENDLSVFLGGFKTTNDGLTDLMGELESGFQTIQATALKCLQLLQRNPARGRALAEGQLQAEIERYQALLRERQGYSRTDLIKSEKVLVVNAAAMAIGLLVDSVHEVVSIPRTAIDPAPELVLSQVDSAYLQGIAKMEKDRRMILLLNIDEILSQAQFGKLLALRQVGAEAAAPAGEAGPAARPAGRRKLKIDE